MSFPTAMRLSSIAALILIALATSSHGATDRLAFETRLHAAFPKEYRTLSEEGIPKDDTGLLGRNRSWGKLYSPRFQMGAGRALRFALVAGDEQSARRAYLGIKKGTEAIEKSGYVRTTVPASISHGRSPSNGDIAAAASFYLGDACLGMIAVEASPNAGKIANKQSRGETEEALRRATAWLLSQQKVLMKSDSRAPNRLLFDARAFQACGALVHSNRAPEVAATFVAKAIRSMSPVGYFREGGGWDTSYQAVAINVGRDVLLAGFPSTKLETALYQAAKWLAGRVDRRGRVNSSGNKRTCAGGESFLGNPKKLAIGDVFMALASLGTMKQDRSLLDAARRVSGWYARNRGQDPCFQW